MSDTGCGVAAEDLPRLFERFFRGRTTQARTHEGSGIGLSLVHELVKLHGGSIEARSKVGVGTAITLRIPRGSAHLPPERIGRLRTLERARIGALPFVEEALGWLPDGGSAAFNPEPGQAPSISESEAPRADDEAQARVLIVDDNADMRGYLRHLLGGRWQVETAPDGVVAMEHIRQRLPDLVIADVMMPVMDGFALLNAIRANDGVREVTCHVAFGARR